MRTRFIALAVLGVACLAVPAALGAPSAAAKGKARTLYERALGHLDRNDIDSRRMAIIELERATLLDPTAADYQLTLARAYYKAGFIRKARGRYEAVVRMSPTDAHGRYGLAQVWRRDWLKYLDRKSLGRSIDFLKACTTLDPGYEDAWLMMVPLLLEQNDSLGALAAARSGLIAEPKRPDALLALAYTSYRLGHVARAESAFVVAIPRLPRLARERFDDISPVATQKDTVLLHQLDADHQLEFTRRFWADLDPDLATVVNEAQLEYWARVAHAYFLFFDPKRREWDERGEVYVRYGPPRRTDYNPVGISLYDRFGTPRNVLLWDYPDLGMRVVMEDRLLSEYYLLPITMSHDPDPRPDPDSLARLEGSLATREGRGIFRMLPPGVESLPVDGAIARFPIDTGARLLAQIESPGGPADSLWAEWVVMDSTRHAVARGARALSNSACDPTERRVADFAADLPPGDYQVGLTVRQGDNKRGVYRQRIVVGLPSAALVLSDVVISCGAPDIRPVPGAAPIVRIEPNPAARVDGNDPLTAYFEINHLSPGGNGQSRFEYVYTVKSAARDPRIWLKRVLSPREKVAPISASREEEQSGSIRRQFVSVPIQALPAGKYRLEIRVRDLVANDEVVRTAEFVKVAAAEPLRN